MAKHYFARLLITLALVSADPLARILERLDTLERENKEIKAQLNVTAGALLTFADGRTKCPEGYVEPPQLKGRMMTTTPIGGKSGATFNRPFDAGEEDVFQNKNGNARKSSDPEKTSGPGKLL